MRVPGRPFMFASFLVLIATLWPVFTGNLQWFDRHAGLFYLGLTSGAVLALIGVVGVIQEWQRQQADAKAKADAQAAAQAAAAAQKKKEIEDILKKY